MTRVLTSEDHDAWGEHGGAKLEAARQMDAALGDCVGRSHGASKVGNALDEQRFTPPKIEVRPSASGARRRGATLEVAR